MTKYNVPTHLRLFSCNYNVLLYYYKSLLTKYSNLFVGKMLKGQLQNILRILHTLLHF
jgi:hypothetical protein